MHIPDYLQCGHEPQSPQTIRRIFRAEPLEFFQLQSAEMLAPFLLYQM